MRSDIIINHSVILTKSYGNLPKSYNEAATIILNNFPQNTFDAILFVHEDVYLPDEFESQITKAIKSLPIDWAVCGVAGARMINGKRQEIGHILDRGMNWGRPIKNPIPVQTVDELCVILNSEWFGEKGLQFDENMPLDYFGSDICMQAIDKGLSIHVIPGYCEHNSSRLIGGRTPAFFEAQAIFRNKWIKHLPIAGTCGTVEL